MRPGALTLVLLFVLSSLRAANGDAGPAIEFTGVIIADGKTKIALTDRATGTTDWIETGGAFKGYTITRYDAQQDAITVKKDGREEQLRLVAAKSAATTTTTTASATLPPPAPAVAPVSAQPSPNANLALPLPTAPPSTPAATQPSPTVNVAVITPTPAAPEAPNYTAREGDTLTTVAAATGVSLDQLKVLNPGVNPVAIIKAGEPIRTRER